MVSILEGLYCCEPKIDTSDLMLEILAKIAILSQFFSDLRSFVLEFKTLRKRENDGSLKNFMLALPSLHKCRCIPAKMCFKVEPGYGFQS